MMTEEETGEEGNYIRHRPGWRAENFNKLIDLLDIPREGLKNHSLAKPRQLGSPSTSSPPSATKKWMVEQPIEQNEEIQSAEEQDEELQSELFAEFQ